MSEMVQDRHPGTCGPGTRGPRECRDSWTPGLADPGTRGLRDKWDDTEKGHADEKGRVKSGHRGGKGWLRAK